MKLHKVVLSAVAAVALAATATSASAGGRGSLKDDRPFSWTGFYMGAHAGWARSDLDVTDVDGCCGPVGNVTNSSGNAPIFGLQAGYNWQSGAIVFGIEGDIGFIGLDHDKILTFSASQTRVGIESGLYGDITGRLGVAAGRTLFYAKGGWAFFDPSGENFSTLVAGVAVSNGLGTFTGWTLGGGIEHRFSSEWSVKLEYQHYDFGTEQFTVSASGTPFRYKEDLTIDTVKVGLNYQFK